jgi:phosphate transport system permease protein
MSVTIDEDPLKELEADAFPGERRRQITNLLMHAVLLLVMIATVGVLAWVLVYVAGQGLKYLGPEFLTQTPASRAADS